VSTATHTANHNSLHQVEADLRRAAEFILRNGLHRRSNYDYYDAEQSAGGIRPCDCRVDVIGAVRIAIFGTPIPANLDESKDQRYGDALEHLTAWVRYAYGLRLFPWFDRARNTAEHTASDLRDAAAWRPETHR
jgi:hypothetical protein